jgi:hypothetical protein
MPKLFYLACLLLIGLAPHSLRAQAVKPDPAAIEFFEKHVRPMLVERCAECHNAKVKRAGLRMDSRQALLVGGDSGPSIVPGSSGKSLLIQAVKQQGDLKMPPKGKEKLSEAQIALLARWIDTGAVWPEEKVTAPVLTAVAEARKNHWAFRPVAKVGVPELKDATPATTPIDRFLLAKLQAKGLSFSEQADRRTLIRRLSFDLLGLPPTPEEVEAFLNDARADAYERLVDRLLASPAYGERWGRHWLDLARYSDTKGYVFQEERKYAYSYTYRDYVVAALNEDKPYDRFIIEQLAADRLENKDRRSLAAMGFLTLGRRFLNNIHDIIDDRIDVVSRGLMGLSVSCARCHDHKYDPIPTRDYYSIYGIFQSSQEPKDLPLIAEPDPMVSANFDKGLRERQSKLDAYLDQQRLANQTKFRSQIGSYLLAVRDARNKPGEKAQNAVEVRQPMVQRWRDRLAKASKERDPIFVPLVRYAELSQAEFAAKAPEVTKQLAKEKVNPLIAAAFAQSPTDFIEVTKRYQEVFTKIDNTATKDADREALRLLLHGPESPILIAANDIDRFLDRAQRDRAMALRRQIEAWKANAPGSPPRAHVLADLPTPVMPRVLVRGNPGSPGVTVPRQFLEILSPDRKPFNSGSGRLELAQAIASKDNPLTARVMVNRLWMHHFGKALVTTPGDFGVRGEAPTHPELLDWLATEFVESGWSLKHMHRLMLLSSAWKQRSEESDKNAAIDPENALLSHMNRRRLEFEPLRDALLSASGKLDRAMGGKGVEITTAPFPPRRTIYAYIERQNLPGVFRTFDLASPDVAIPQRHSTTVPQQSLFLMNNPFLHDLSRGLASRPEVVNAKDDVARVDLLHRLCYGRAAEPEEVNLGLSFLKEPSKGGSLSTLEQYAQVLLLANEFAFVD